MLKKMITKKILISTFCLFALFLLYMIPKDTIYTLKDIKQEVNYVEQNKNLQTVFLLDKDQMLGKTEYVSDVLSSQDINEQMKVKFLMVFKPSYQVILKLLVALLKMVFIKLIFLKNY